MGTRILFKARRKKIQIVCENCGYEWKTSSKLHSVTCPSCLNKTSNPIYTKPQPMEHFNLNEHGVRVLDPSLHWIVDVYFKPNKAWCSYCESENCKHIKFALSLPDVQNIIKKKGWKIKE
jgi:hypothetical protein